jgi:type IV pilus assembly protein PilC
MDVQPTNTNSTPEVAAKSTESAKAGAKPAKKPAHKPIFGGISRESAEYLMDNLSMLMNSGVTVGEALDSLASEMPDQRPKKTLIKMRAQIDEGVPFYQALADTNLFSQSVLTLIEIGESSGNLADNLKVVATQMHKNNAMSAKVRSAMLYPAFLVTLLFLVGTGIGVFLLPRLLKIIQTLHVKVGPVTQALISMGTFFGHFGILIIALLAIIIFGVITAVRISQRARWSIESVMFKLPGVKRLLFETEVARFGFVLGTLMDAGLPVNTSLESLAHSMSTHRYQKFTANLQQKVEEGSSFSQVLSDPKNHKLLPGTICQIIISAERSGNLAPSLLNIGQTYQDKAELTARNLETLLEPIVLVILAAGVLFVALAVFLPIYSLIGNFNGAGR